VRSSLGAPTLTSRKKPQPVPSMRSRLDANWSRLAGWRLRARKGRKAEARRRLPATSHSPELRVPTPSSPTVRRRYTAALARRAPARRVRLLDAVRGPMASMRLTPAGRWRDSDSNRGHRNFQSRALPAELSRRGCAMLAIQLGCARRFRRTNNVGDVSAGRDNRVACPSRVSCSSCATPSRAGTIPGSTITTGRWRLVGSGR
jgi:hypothetical protein